MDFLKEPINTSSVLVRRTGEVIFPKMCLRRYRGLCFVVRFIPKGFRIKILEENLVYFRVGQRSRQMLIFY